MTIDVIEEIDNGSLDRPLKGLMLENGIHIFETKQEILDQQAISLGRVKGAVIFARDIKKFLIFNETGETYEEKDIPGGQDLDDYAKIEDLLKIYIGGDPATVDSIKTGVGLTWNYNAGTKELEVSNEYALRDKVTYDNSTSNTNSTGQGKVLEFLGVGSTSAVHNHEFNDSGVFWLANFQVPSARDKTVNVTSAVTSVSMSSYKVPVNMIARFSYAKDTNKMYSECSYIRPELIDYVPGSYVTEQLEINNDEIITPEQGEVFQFIDDTITDGYGVEGGTKQTYWSPNDGLQKDLLLSNIDYSKVFCIHRETNSTHIYLMVHESYASQIYNRDVTGVNELTMLFGPNARGRFSSYNMTSPAGSVWNWNGQAIPEDNDPNELQPTVWVTPEGDETTEWSTDKEIIATCCYSSGTLANDGSAILRRGDVRFDPATKTSSFEDDNASPFYVMPIRAGGGTFGDIKVFSFFMSRRSKETLDWDSYIFDDSAACIGTILKIAYDAAIELETQKEANQEEQLLAGMAGGQLFVNEIKVG